MCDNTTNYLVKLREDSGRTVEDISRELGWSVNEYVKKEKNPLEENITDLCTIVQVLNGNLGDFFNALERDFNSYSDKRKDMKNCE